MIKNSKLLFMDKMQAASFVFSIFFFFLRGEKQGPLKGVNNFTWVCKGNDKTNSDHRKLTDRQVDNKLGESSSNPEHSDLEQGNAVCSMGSPLSVPHLCSCLHRLNCIATSAFQECDSCP